VTSWEPSDLDFALTLRLRRLVDLHKATGEGVAGTRRGDHTVIVKPFGRIATLARLLRRARAQAIATLTLLLPLTACAAPGRQSPPLAVTSDGARRSPCCEGVASVGSHCGCPASAGACGVPCSTCCSPGPCRMGEPDPTQ